MRIMLGCLSAVALTACANVAPGNKAALTTADQVAGATKFTMSPSGIHEAKGPTMRSNGKTWLVAATRGQTGDWDYRLELASDSEDVTKLNHASSAKGAEFKVVQLGLNGTSCRAYSLNCRVERMVAIDLDDADMSASGGGLDLSLKGDGGSVSASAPGYYVQGVAEAIARYDAKHSGQRIDLF